MKEKFNYGNSRPLGEAHNPVARRTTRELVEAYERVQGPITLEGNGQCRVVASATGGFPALDIVRSVGGTNVRIRQGLTAEAIAEIRTAKRLSPPDLTP